MVIYSNETKFYRHYLRISYEFGSQLRRTKVLQPDAEMDDKRPLFLCDVQSVERHREKIAEYRGNVAAARHNALAV